MDNQNAEFPQGMFFKSPHPNAPEYVLGAVKIKLDEAINWLYQKQQAGEQWVSLDVKRSQQGKGYMQVNTWKPQQQQQMPQHQQQGYQQPPQGAQSHVQPQNGYNGNPAPNNPQQGYQQQSNPFPDTGMKGEFDPF